MRSSTLSKCVSLCLILIVLSMTNAIDVELQQETSTNPVQNEAQIHAGLICQKEFSYLKEYFGENPETLQNVIELLETIQLCQNELQFSQNGVCTYSYDKINDLTAQVRNNKTLMNLIENVKLLCSSVPNKIIDFVALLIQEHKLTQDQIDLKDPQVSNISPQQTHNLQLSRETKDIINMVIFSPIIAPYVLMQSIIQAPTLAKIALLPVSPILAPLAAIGVVVMNKAIGKDYR